jgi:hypothetical protein
VICLAGSAAWARQAISPFERDCRLPRCLNSVSKIDMNRGSEHHEFASDNTAGICPEVLAALEEANHDAAVSYGDDE